MTTPWQTFLDAELAAATTDAERTAAIQGALDLIPAQVGRSLTYPPLNVPFFGMGGLALTAQSDGVCLRVKQPMRLHFDGNALLVPFGAAAGIVVERLAEGTVIDGVTVAGVTQVAAVADEDAGTGIRIEAVFVVLRDVLVTDLAIGVELYGAHGGEQDYFADFIDLDRVVYRRCAVGLHISTGDAMHGVTLGNIFHQGGIGIHNESFLGNCHVGTVFHSTRDAAVITPNAVTYDTWVGAQLEQDCNYGHPEGVADAIQSNAHASTWLGGSAIGAVRVGDRVGLGYCRLSFRDELPGGGYVSVAIPHGANKSALTLNIYNPNQTLRESHGIRWTDYAPSGEYAGVIGLRPSGSSETHKLPIGYTLATHPGGGGRVVHNATAPEEPGEVLPKKEKP